MDNEMLKEALKQLEQEQHNEAGYGVKEILTVLNIAINRKNEKLARAKLRSMISQQLYPEFATAGDDDIVYCPNGKGTGRYRLSK